MDEREHMLQLQEDGCSCPGDLDEVGYNMYMLRLLSKVMEEGKYPGISLGSYMSLTKHGLRLQRYSEASIYSRSNLKDEHASDSDWRTFRDVDTKQAESIVSLYTGTKARPFNKRWIDVMEGQHTTIQNGDV